MHNVTPPYLLEMAEMYHDEAKRKVEEAKKTVPNECHSYLMLLSKEKVLCTELVPLDETAIALKMGHNQEGTYVLIMEPYLGVDGRVFWARKEHKDKNKRLDITTQVVGNAMVCVTVESEMYGKAMGSAQWNPNKAYRGYDLQSVETAAVGRALGFLGYGLLGTGIASAEEVIFARKLDLHNTESQNGKQNTAQQGNPSVDTQKGERNPQNHSHSSNSSTSQRGQHSSGNHQSQSRNGAAGRNSQTGSYDQSQQPNAGRVSGQRNEGQITRQHYSSQRNGQEQPSNENGHQQNRQSGQQNREAYYHRYRVLDMEGRVFERLNNEPFYALQLLEIHSGNEFEAIAVREIYEYINSINFSEETIFEMDFEERSSTWVITHMQAQRKPMAG